MRFLAVLFPDWPITANGYGPNDRAACLTSGTVSACSAAAYSDGVRIGQRRREAKRHSPTLSILTHDPYRDSQAFEPIVAALSAVVPRIEVTQPGLCTMAADGPSRYYGSERALAILVDQTARDGLLAQCPSAVRCLSPPRVGVADSRFAAKLAAQESQPESALIVPPGRSREFLAPFPISTLGLDDLTTLSRRLGIHTLGQFADLPMRAVLTRFGAAAAESHQLARGEHRQPLAIHELTEPMAVTVELDPPAERVDIATFAARPLAEELIELLTRRGLACTQLRIDAETEHAQVQSRLWRATTVFDAEAIVERVRWQLTGWLNAKQAATAAPLCEANRYRVAKQAATAAPLCEANRYHEPQPTAGISLLRLFADEVAGAADLQISLWGEMSESDRRAVRGLDRVRGLLGPGGVLTAVLRGGRGPAERVQFVPWGEPTPTVSPPMPWPGQVPKPSPSLVHPAPLAVDVTGANGPVGITARGELNNSPTRICLPDGRWQPITGWAGPWLADEQWWEPESRQRLARFQIMTAERGAYLCAVQRNTWWIEATYD